MRSVIALVVVLFGSACSATAGAAEGAEGPTDARAASNASPAITIEWLMQRFASSGNVRASFRERKHLALLKEPIESSGVLYFAPPGRFARHVTEPGRSSVVIDGDLVVFRDELGEQRVRLEESEVARVFVDNLVSVLRGDLEALRERYEVAFAARAETWSLGLVPRSRLARRLIDSIRIEGDETQLTRMESVEATGDRTITEFLRVEVGVEFAAEDLESIFSLEPAAPAS